MLRETKTQKLFDLHTREKIINMFSLSIHQSLKIDKYINQINEFNKHTNIVGKSTLINPWKSHVLDCIQLSNFMANKKSSILDMGTGAGLPGIILAINNYSNVSLIDSNSKKITFLRSVCSKLNIKVKTHNQRIEKLININFDCLVSRALSNLNKLFFYSHKLLRKNGALIFLKGRHVKDEIQEASKIWSFNYKIYRSISDERGNVIVIKGLNKND